MRVDGLPVDRVSTPGRGKLSIVKKGSTELHGLEDFRQDFHAGTQAGRDSRQNPANGRASIVPSNESLSREPNVRTRAYSQTPSIVRRIETTEMWSRSSIRSHAKEGQHGFHRTIERIRWTVPTQGIVVLKDAWETPAELLPLQKRS